jgi:hypothetical protein
LRENFITEYLNTGNILTSYRKFFVVIYTGVPNYLLIVNIPKALCKSRMSCDEIEVYHNVRHNTSSEIYTYAASFIFELHSEHEICNIEKFLKEALGRVCSKRTPDVLCY